MLSAILIILIPAITLMAFLFGYHKGVEDTKPAVKNYDNEPTPIHDYMALKYPQTYMMLKSKRYSADV